MDVHVDVDCQLGVLYESKQPSARVVLNLVYLLRCRKVVHGA